MKSRVVIGLISLFLSASVLTNIISAVDAFPLYQVKDFFTLGTRQAQSSCNLPPVSIMPLGDSITHGSGIAGGYRIGLWNLFLANNRPVDFVGSQVNGPATIDRDHEGHPGKPIQYIQQEIGGWLGANRPQIILLMIGTNDMLYPQTYDLDSAPRRLSALIQQITLASPETDLFVASIPPIQSPIANEYVEWFNATIPDTVAAYARVGRRVHYVDINSALTVADLADGIHPNFRGYTKIAQLWYDAIVSSIQWPC
jgi:lysophospholipase L1-like esterase